MSRCEDWPACGHELGCCPDFDEETGEQTNMVCLCGAKLPLSSRFSICAGCLRDPDDNGGYEPEDYESDKDDEFEDDLGDAYDHEGDYDYGEVM